MIDSEIRQFLEGGPWTRYSFGSCSGCDARLLLELPFDEHLHGEDDRWEACYILFEKYGIVAQVEHSDQMEGAFVLRIKGAEDIEKAIRAGFQIAPETEPYRRSDECSIKLAQKSAPRL